MHTKLWMVPLTVLVVLALMVAPVAAQTGQGDVDYASWPYGPQCTWDSWGHTSQGQSAWGVIRKTNNCQVQLCIRVAVTDQGGANTHWLGTGPTCMGPFTGAGTTASSSGYGTYFGRRLWTEGGCYQDTIFTGLARIDCGAGM